MKHSKSKLTSLLFFSMPALFLLTSCSLISGSTLKKEQLVQIEDIVNREIEKESFPGAVVCIGQGNKILYLKAFGEEVKTPYSEPMSENTIFDMASITKPVATATSVMILIDREKISPQDKVGKYLPAFACNGKEEATIHHLLTHTSGLPPYTNADNLKKEFGAPCPEKVIEKICRLEAKNKPGEKFVYSCLGYITLGRIVEIVTGRQLDEFAKENIYKPLKMKNSTFNPPEFRQENIAATEIKDDELLRGFVHDPLAQLMDGVSGNAGLFSNARDLSIYCRMLLNDGTLNGKKILSPRSVELLTTHQSHNRSYGFDINSNYAWIKGSYSPPNGFCHSGYTGTSLVCDPENKIYLIILTNRAHPHDKGTVKPVRKQVADVVFSRFWPSKEEAEPVQAGSAQ